MSNSLDILINGTKKMFKEFFNKETNKKQRANMLTFSRILIAPIIPTLIVFNLPIIAALTVLLGCFTDYLDGKSARKYNSSSEYGALLDQVVDKFFAGFVGIALSILNPIFLINLLGEVLISATNIIYKSKYKDLDIKSTIIGKIKQWPLAFTFALGFLSLETTVLPTLINTSITVTSIFQIASLGSYIINNNKEIEILKNYKKINITDNQIVNNTNTDEHKNILSNEKNIIDKNNAESKKDEYIKLKYVLNEILNSKDKQNIEISKQYQKRKNDLN